MKNTNLLVFRVIYRTSKIFPKMKSIYEGKVLDPKNKLETRFLVWFLLRVLLLSLLVCLFIKLLATSCPIISRYHCHCYHHQDQC